MELLTNGKTGESLRVLESTPELLRFEFVLAPGASIPGVHLHPNSEQRIVVLDGELHLRVGGQRQIVGPGETYAVAPGTPHFQWNPSEKEVRAYEEYRPPGRLYLMFATFFRLAEAGMLSRGGRVVSPLLVAAFFAEFRDEVRASPRLHQWGLDRLAPFARRLGYDKAIRRAMEGSGATRSKTCGSRAYASR